MHFNDFFSQKNQINVGGTNITLPLNYTENGTSASGALIITNGTHDIYISEVNDTNVNKHISDYVNIIEEKNETLNITNFTADNVLFYKSINVNNPNSIHYWFVKNGKTYSVCTFDGNPKLEDIVVNIYQEI